MDVNNFLGIATSAISLVQKVSEVRGVKAKMDALEMNMGMVSARKADISFQLEQEERRPGKKRKKEVDFWMQSVGSLEEQVHGLGRKVKEEHFFSQLMLQDQVSGLATEVEKLHEKGRFDNGLTLNVKPAPGYELQLRELVRQASFYKSLRMLNRLSFKPPLWLFDTDGTPATQADSMAKMWKVGWCLFGHCIARRHCWLEDSSGRVRSADFSSLFASACPDILHYFTKFHV